MLIVAISGGLLRPLFGIIVNKKGPGQNPGRPKLTKHNIKNHHHPRMNIRRWLRIGTTYSTQHIEPHQWHGLEYLPGHSMNGLRDPLPTGIVLIP